MKARRKAIGMSAEQVAEQLHISPSTVYRYENGDIGKMGIDKLTPIAVALRCTPAYLMGWDDDADKQDFKVGIEVQNSGQIPLSDVDPELLKRIADLSKSDQQLILAMLKRMVDTGEKTAVAETEKGPYFLFNFRNDSQDLPEGG